MYILFIFGYIFHNYRGHVHIRGGTETRSTPASWLLIQIWNKEKIKLLLHPIFFYVLFISNVHVNSNKKIYRAKSLVTKTVTYSSKCDFGSSNLPVNVICEYRLIWEWLIIFWKKNTNYCYMLWHNFCCKDITHYIHTLTYIKQWYYSYKWITCHTSNKSYYYYSWFGKFP